MPFKLLTLFSKVSHFSSKNVSPCSKIVSNEPSRKTLNVVLCFGNWERGVPHK